MRAAISHVCSFRRFPCRYVVLCVLAMLSHPAVAATDSPRPIPFVKQWTAGAGYVPLTEVSVVAENHALQNEVGGLNDDLTDLGIHLKDDGTPIRLETASVSFPDIESAYRESIEAQGYRLVAADDGILLQARTPAGIFYAIQTLVQLIDSDRRVPKVEILDWPDLAIRGVMVDPARKNENMNYYRRVIEFCARYKINRIHVHLTDDENACLYQEDYPWLMHPHAWRADEVRSLVAFAERRHVDLVPEIESLGHARLFLRHPDFREILHQTTEDTPRKSWAGTSVPGYTNVLCPASEKTYEYLSAMYDRAAAEFPYPELHIGCDEVDMTTCARCEAKWPGSSPPEWFLRHLMRCRDLVEQHHKRVALWGDMLLHYPEIVDRVPTRGTVIYDWHYRPNMSDESAVFFKKKGFDVIGCPALVCHPHMIFPTDYNYRNIQSFAEIARTHDLWGLDTTIWAPTRYLSDVLWTGIGYAAVQAWSGSNWDETAFYRQFARDFFGSPEGVAFGEAWKSLYAMRWWLDDFKLGCWTDEDGLAQAREKVDGPLGAKARDYLERVKALQMEFERIGGSVRKNRVAWEAIEQSVAVFSYALQHFLAAENVKQNGEWNVDLIRKLDASCERAIGWIEADWDRNAFADDPYKKDLNHTGQHLLDRFTEMHAFHQRILKEAASAKDQ
jgi:hypothetical protein